MEKILKMKNILCVLKWLFVVLLLATLFALIIQVRNIICNCSPFSFCELLFNWCFLKYLLVACFSLLTLYVAGKQLQKQSDTACITALTELREQLTSKRNRNIHFALLPEDEQKTILERQRVDEKLREENGLIQEKKILKIDILNYLGTLELGVLMVRKNLIDTKTFYSQFGYRIENIFEEENSDIHIEVRKHINGAKSYYKNLLWGYKKIRKKFVQ